MAIIPSKATPEMLNRKINDDERIMSRSSVEFTKKVRREAMDQDNRARGKLLKPDSVSDESSKDIKRRRTSSPVVPSVEGSPGVLTRRNRN
ncbi:unnamed protein product [Strongylus vulgaris]|uniref:Uncharacterized protein n=1 Tax=Strongylus vulgaris TaxID=40348 RepID=A0A3P7LT09_STRVU|nr:unnamed protein product [Strongylus vulgaris]